MQTRIRPATLSDAHAVVDLMAQLTEHAYGHVDSGVEDRFRTMLELPEYAILVAKDEDDRVIGLLSASQRRTLWHAGPFALIEELVVDEDVRRHGVGRALMQAALEWARAQGCSELEISTDQENADAQAFYRRLGFESEALLLEYELD